MDAVGSPRLHRTSVESGHPQAQWFNTADITVAHQSHLLKQLDQQRCQELFCDCSVLVDGRLFRAHRNVLFASSGYFRMLLSPRSPDRDRHPGLSDATFDAFSPDTFALILDFIYSGQLSLSRHNAIEVMSAASYLQMNGVIGYCKTFIKSLLEITVKEGEVEVEGGGGCEQGLDLAEVQGPFSSGDGDENLSAQEVSHPHHLSLHHPDDQTPVGSGSPPPAHLAQQVFMPKDPDRATPAPADHDMVGGGITPHAGFEEANSGVEDPLDPLTTSSPKQRCNKRGAKRMAPYYCTRSTNTNFQEAPSQEAVKAEELSTISPFQKSQRHLLRLLDMPQYPCQACGKSYTRLDHLERHVNHAHLAGKRVCRKCKSPATRDLCAKCFPGEVCENLPIEDPQEDIDQKTVRLLGVDTQSSPPLGVPFSHEVACLE